VVLALVAFAAAFLVALISQTPAHAGESFEWTGEGNDGNWVNSCNWHPEGNCKQTYPGKSASDDQAIIKRNASAPAHVALGEDMTVSSLSLEGEGVSLTGGNITVSNNLNWTGGVLDIDVTTGTASVNIIDGPADKVLAGDLTNNGVLSLGSTPVAIGAGSKITNNGVFFASEGAAINGSSCCVDAPRIVNNGRFLVANPIGLPLPGSEQVTVSNVSFDAAGTISTGDGVLELRGAPGQIQAGTKFIGDGKVRVTALADLRMHGRFEVSQGTEIELASVFEDSGQGRLSGTGTMEGTGQFLWTGGDVVGTLTLGSGIQTYISGPNIKDLSGKVTNGGRAVFAASDPQDPPTGQLRFGPSGELFNRGVFLADERTGMVGVVCCTAPASFNNIGELVVRPSGTTTPGTFTMSNLLFRAGGDVHIERGSLELRRGPGVLGSAANITGAGTIRVTDLASMTLDGEINLGPETTLELGSCSGECGLGSLTGVGTLQGGGRFNWLGGVVREGAEIKIAEGNRMVISGTAAKELQGRITNEGNARFVPPTAPATAGGPLVFVGTAQFTNAGTFNVGDRSAMNGTICCADPARFVNLQDGRFVFSAPLMPSTGTASVSNMVFENHGTVELASGTLRLGRLGGYKQFVGSTKLVGGGLTSEGSLVEILGGAFAGTGTITADVRHARGTVSPGAPGTARSTGILKIAGDYIHLPNATLRMNLKGNTPGTGFDQLQVTSTASLNGGTLDLDTASGYSPGSTTRLKVLAAGTRSGSFATLKDPLLPNGRKWYAVYNPKDVTLGVRRA
jgi:hypothetical protein